jgi:hypothetical protein
LPKPFLAGIIFWLSMLMFGINLIVAPDRIVFVSTVVGALCLSAALFLILQLEHPFEWVLRLSSEPLRNALGSINR